MIDESKKQKFAEQKEQVRRRINTKVDHENYEFIPAKKPIDYYDTNAPQRVAVYARVSTGNVQQTISYELQKKYYEDFVVHHPNWTLVSIYADVDSSYGRNPKLPRMLDFIGTHGSFLILVSLLICENLK